jgi:hypothetical protein
MRSIDQFIKRKLHPELLPELLHPELLPPPERHPELPPELPELRLRSGIRNCLRSFPGASPPGFLTMGSALLGLL